MSWFSKIATKTLYHGTCTFNKPDIEKIGLIPSAGQFSDEMYGDYYDKLPELNFAADKQQLQVCVNAMERCIAFHLKKESWQVNENDIRNYGLLAIFKGAPGSAKPEDTGWQHRNKDDDYFDLDSYPNVEPGDYFSEGIEKPDILLKGAKLIDFLKRNGLIRTQTDNKQYLINMVQKYHPQIPIKEVINKVNSLSDVEISKSIQFYRKELQKTQTK